MNKLANFFRNNLVGRIVFSIGLLIVAFSFFTFASIEDAKYYNVAEATVSKAELYQDSYIDENHQQIKAGYTIYVKYLVNDTEYEEEYGIFPNYKVGDKIKICYNPINPSEISKPVSFLLPIVLLVIGIIVVIVGIISLIVAYKTDKALKIQQGKLANDSQTVII